MKMVPFHSKEGLILGHVNRDMCRQTHNSFVIDSGPEDWFKVSKPMGGPDDIYVELYHLRFRKIEFRCHNDLDQTVYHLVVDEKTLPSWFWKAKAIVKFSPDSWTEVRP